MAVRGETSRIWTQLRVDRAGPISINTQLDYSYYINTDSHMKASWTGFSALLWALDLFGPSQDITRIRVARGLGKIAA